MRNDGIPQHIDERTDIAVRRMRADDLEDAQALMVILGYDIDPDDLRARFAEITRRDNHAVFVAEDERARVVGLVHVYVRAALEKPVEAMIQSLTVLEEMQGKGIGGRLMQEAEAWAKIHGLGSVALYTQVQRDGAVSFYLRQGYSEANQSRLLRKKLGGT